MRVRRPLEAGSDADARADLARARRLALTWYRRQRRDLPWRRGRDPYRIWIAEVMLQQTRVDTVLGRYERFLERFPDVRTLARAPLDAVLHAWSGLGYYRRARHLHAAARRIVDVHAGSFPSRPEELAALPGVGRYTAGALGSIAFGRPDPVLDGNAARVLCRLLDIDAGPASGRLWHLAAAWARGPHPGDANQALMELGAVVCTPARPRCSACPVASLCRALARGRARARPRPRRRRASERDELVALCVRRRGRLLLVRRASGTLLGGFWEVPTARGAPEAHPGALALLARRLGVVARRERRLGGFRHAILHHALRVHVVLARADGGGHRRPPRPAAAAAGAAIANLDLGALEMRWATAADLAALPLSTVTRKALRLAAAACSTRGSWDARGTGALVEAGSSARAASAAPPRAPRARPSSRRGT